MKLWLKKIFVVLISIITLGLYVPVIDLEADNDSNNNQEAEQKKQQEANTVEILIDESPSLFERQLDPIAVLAEQARSQTMTKLGTRITEQINQDLLTQILPGIEEVIEMVLSNSGQDQTPHVEIIEDSSYGYGEKIFDLYDVRNNQTIAKFHVRRDNRPQDGYWFNFHYHVPVDNYETHHTIGEIYWSKNTPPKWMS